LTHIFNHRLFINPYIEDLMKVVVITGSTQGIGYGLAAAFLAQGCRVVVSGRTVEKVERVAKSLAEKYNPEQVLGVPCDVTDYDQVLHLWTSARTHFGRIDIWINNAGQGNAPTDFWKLDPSLIQNVISTNVIGAMYGAKVALQGMLDQGHGAIYNMEGKGSDGSRTPGLTLYGSTKYSLHYLSRALVEEVKGTPILVGTLSPGMVVTALLTDPFVGRPDEWRRVKKIFNILADPVEVVAPWMVGEILKNRKNGVVIAWLTKPKVIWRFLTAGFNKRDLFKDWVPEAQDSQHVER
jgi:NAD(P)-dependent dehydrogenase (short-subunit alcohol dehydrogenase family)